MKMMTISNKHKKISSKVLILCIDRDDDLGIKTPIRTPVIGLKNCQNAAIKLALSDPEEADANAIFAERSAVLRHPDRKLVIDYYFRTFA